MRNETFLRRIITLGLLMIFSLSLFVACGGEKEPTASDAIRPTRLPANNAKPDLIKEDNKYANVPIYDKFGAWPQKTGDEYYSSEVGTWYTIWWQAEGHASYELWYRSDWTRLKPVDYGYYGSGDTDYLTSVLARMKYIDIDFVMIDDTNSPETGYYTDIATNLYRVFKTASQMDGFAPKLAIATGGAIRDFDNAEQQQADFDRYYNSVYKRYAELFYHYEEKPLLLMYVANKPDVRYQDNQNRFTQRYGTGFISWQNLSNDTSLYTTQGNWGWVWDMQNEGTEVIGVQPGYNKGHQGPYFKPFPRDNGVRYTQMWLDAIKKNPQFIMIASYNDHAEETGWEATTPIRKPIASAGQDCEGEDPYVYEKITEAYLALRYGYIEGFYYQVENTKQVYQCVNGYLEKVKSTAAEKAGEPVILLPEGYIEWELTRDRGEI